MKSEYQNFITAIFVGITTIYLLTVIFQNRFSIFTTFNYNEIKRLYDQSQWQQSQNISPLKMLDSWALKNGYTGWNNYVDENKSKLDTEKVKNNIVQTVRNKGISDATLYTYAGYEYIRGADPTLLNPEHPPLGKYLIGLSIMLFGNEHIILLLTGLCILSLVFYLVYLETRQHISASIALFLTSTHTLFIDQIIHGPQLEIFQTVFFLLLLVFLVLYEKRRQIFIIVFAGISFGLLLSVKMIATYYPLFFIWIVLLTRFSKNVKWREVVTVNFIGISTFILAYGVYFLRGGTMRKWLGVQKYIVMFYKQSGIHIAAFVGNYLRLIFTGNWKFWSDNNPVSHYNEWSPFWTVIFLMSGFLIFKYFRSKKQKSFLASALGIFIVIYNFFLFVVPIFPRYLLLLFVPMTILIGISTKNLLFHEKSK